jgi:hypothetical protein
LRIGFFLIQNSISAPTCVVFYFEIPFLHPQPKPNNVAPLAPPSRFYSLALALASTAVAVPTQINIHYTPTVGTLSLDFVSTSADGVAQYGTSSNPATFTNATTSSFNFAEIGYLHQTTMTFAATPGASAFYRACSANSCSQVFHIIPNQVDETFAVCKFSS